MSSFLPKQNISYCFKVVQQKNKRIMKNKKLVSAFVVKRTYFSIFYGSSFEIVIVFWAFAQSWLRGLIKLVGEGMKQKWHKAYGRTISLCYFHISCHFFRTRTKHFPPLFFYLHPSLILKHIEIITKLVCEDLGSIL